MATPSGQTFRPMVHTGPDLGQPVPLGQHHGIDGDVAYIQVVTQQGHEFAGLHLRPGHDVEQACNAHAVPQQREHDG